MHRQDKFYIFIYFFLHIWWCVPFHLFYYFLLVCVCMNKCMFVLFFVQTIWRSSCSSSGSNTASNNNNNSNSVYTKASPMCRITGGNHSLKIIHITTLTGVHTHLHWKSSCMTSIKSFIHFIFCVSYYIYFTPCI